MLKDFGLSSPVERDHVMEPEEFTKYADICAEQAKTGKPTDPEIVEEIRKGFYESHPKIKKEKLDELWGLVGPAMVKNAGLARFTLDYKGEESDTFFPWLKTMYLSPATALEMSYGAGYDLDGNWLDPVAADDPINYFVKNDPPFAYNRERQLTFATMVADLVHDAPKGEKVKVVDLGAGRLAWARWHGLKLDPEKLTIVAGDMDTTIDPEKLFPGGTAKVGITYKHADLRTQVADPDCQGADLAYLGGVAAYYPLEAFTEAAIKPVYGMLKTGGTFFWDLQVICLYFKRSVGVFGWPKMYLKDSAAATIDMVEEVRKTLWKNGMRFQAEYMMDTYNEFPTAVMIKFTKL